MATTTGPKLAQGTLLKIGDGGTPGAFLTIGRISKIGGPGREREMIESTVLDSTDGYKEYLPGLRDNSEMTIEGQFDATDVGQLELVKNLDEEETTRKFQIVLPTAIGKRWAFDAFVIKFEVDHSRGEILPFSATLKPVGKPVLETTT